MAEVVFSLLLCVTLIATDLVENFCAGLVEFLTEAVGAHRWCACPQGTTPVGLVPDLTFW